MQLKKRTLDDFLDSNTAVGATERHLFSDCPLCLQNRLLSDFEVLLLTQSFVLTQPSESKFLTSVLLRKALFAFANGACAQLCVSLEGGISLM